MRFFSFLLVVVGLSGCSMVPALSGDAPSSRAPCADVVMDRAFLLHGEAKAGLALFYDERDDHRLFQSYYAGVDSVQIARSVGRCWDRRISHYNAMRNLEDANRQLIRVIRRNLPDGDTAGLVSVYREQSAELFQAN